MSFIKNIYKDINKDELIFDGLVIASSIFIRKLMINGTIVVNELPPVTLFVFSFLFVVSISYIMGISFAKYNETYSCKKRKKNFPKYMAWLIFPGVLMIGFIPIIKVGFSDNIRNSFMLIIPVLIIISTVAGYKTETGYSDFKKILEKIAIYFSAITLSVIEAGIYMSKLMSRHPGKDALVLVLALILIGYVPFRLVISFSPPVNKRNLIFALLTIVITVVNIAFF